MDAALKAIIDKRRIDARADMPLCAAMIDELRGVFGNPRGILASENGKKLAWGKPMTGIEFQARVWKGNGHESI